MSGEFNVVSPVRQPEHRLELPDLDAFQRQYLWQLGRRRAWTEEQIDWFEYNLRNNADLMSPESTRRTHQTLTMLRASLKKMESEERGLAEKLGIRLVPNAPMPHEKK